MTDSRKLPTDEFLKYGEMLDEEQRTFEDAQAATGNTTLNVADFFGGLFDWLNGLLMAMHGAHPNRIWEDKQIKKQIREEKLHSGHNNPSRQQAQSTPDEPEEELRMKEVSRAARDEFAVAAAGFAAKSADLETTPMCSPDTPKP